MLLDASLLLALILFNGLFALSEMAVVSSRRARLMQLADEGNSGAARALGLNKDPTRFLSTVQVGITAIGILSGAIGEATIASRLRPLLERIPALAPYSSEIALGIMVVLLTYVSLILGELVPKRLALTRPETIASFVARPMQSLSAVVRPLVTVLSASTDAILRLIRVRAATGPAVSAEEIKVLIEQGTLEGVFEKTERELVTNVLNLDERKVASVMTPRSDVVFLNAQEPFERSRDKLSAHPHSTLPVCDGGLDHVVGFVRSTDLLGKVLAGEAVDLQALAAPPLFVPRSASVMRLLEQFRRTHMPLALVVDEFGDVAGIVSFTDVLSAIVGDLPQEPGEEPRLLRREDGSWLVDGSLDVETLSRALDDESLLSEAAEYHTAGGLVMFALGRIPKTGDAFDHRGFRFEIMDMDGNRVDRILVNRR
jgi:putative hemolysin